MDELLGDDRTPRAFRAKFPEEVLQESLAGQLWFGAECLAAGSSIMNRELESAAMRPLAKAVTKSLDNVRNLLREQCLRIKTPNSPTLNLDVNDAITETLCESLKIFDRLFAEFELLYVSAMVQVKTKQEHEMQELICVLFSETLQRALKLKHLKQDQVDYFDPALMFSIPRLAIVAGLVVYTKGPLNISMSADQLSEMFRPFRTLLIKIRDLLRTLNSSELFQLEQLLCTNEEISLHQQKPTFNCDDKIIINSDDELNNSNGSSCSSSNSAKIVISDCLVDESVASNNNQESSVDVYYITDSNTAPLVSSINNQWDTEDDNKELIDSYVSADCTSGYLIPNTNFGNLLQSNETTLTDRFISSDDEYNSVVNDMHANIITICENSESPGAEQQVHRSDSGFSTAENTSVDRTPESENSEIAPTKTNCSNNNSEEDSFVLSRGGYSENWERLRNSKHSVTDGDESTLQNNSNSNNQQHLHHSYNHSHHHHTRPHIYTTTERTNFTISSTDNPSTSHHRSSHRNSKNSKSEKKNLRKMNSIGFNSSSSHKQHHSKKKSISYNTSGEDETASSLSDEDPQEVVLAIRAAGRLKFK